VKNRTVADVMTRDVLTARPETSLKDVARVLSEHHLSALPVLNSEGGLVGMVSEADLLAEQPGVGRRIRRWRRVVQPSGGTVGRVMSTDLVVVGPDAGLPEAARRMAHHGVEPLPVIDAHGALLGIVSRGDLVRVFLRADDEIRDEIVGEVFTDLLWIDPTEVDVTVVDGVVTLAGTVDDSILADTVERLVRRVDGVVDVRNALAHRVTVAHGGRGGRRLHATARPD
jgi:CBS domain-containing protein